MLVLQQVRALVAIFESCVLIFTCAFPLSYLVCAFSVGNVR